MRIGRLLSVGAVALTVGLTACTDDGAAPVAAPGDIGDFNGDPTADGQPATGNFAPQEIASVVFALSQAEVERAQIALERASSQDVRGFAQAVIEEHAQAIERIDAAFDRFDPPAVERDPTARVLERHGRLVAGDLQTREGAELDLVYMTAEIAAQAQALSMIDRALLPSSRGSQAATGAPANPGGGREGTGNGAAAGPGGAGDGTGSGGETATGGTGGAGAGPGGTGTGGAGPGPTPAGIANTPLGVELQKMRAAASQHLDQALRLHATLRQQAEAGEAPPVR
jgi:predicted outer membrane protein